LTPGFFAGLHYTPQEFSPFFYSVRFCWWMLFSPIAIIAFGYFVIDNTYEQIIANWLIGIPLLLFLFAGYYVAFQKWGWISILVITGGIVLPFYVLDLSRFLRKHYFPESYDKPL